MKREHYEKSKEMRTKEKTLARLRGDAKSGKLRLTALIRGGQPCGEEDLPVWMRGEREVLGCNSVSLLLKADGITHSRYSGISELRLPRAALISYTDDELTIYRAGFREPTEQEERILREWERKQKENPALGYWSQKAFFTERGAAHLTGWDRIRGMRLDFNRKNAGDPEFIQDERIRGEVDMKYKVRMAE